MPSPTECPDCGSTHIEFEEGYGPSRHDPGVPDAWYCNCGWSQAVTKWDRLEDRADIDYENQRDRERGI